MDPIFVTLNLGNCSVTAALHKDYLVLRATDFVAGGESFLSDLHRKSQNRPHNSANHRRPHLGGEPLLPRRRAHLRLRSTTAATQTAKCTTTGTALLRR